MGFLDPEDRIRKYLADYDQTGGDDPVGWLIDNHRAITETGRQLIHTSINDNGCMFVGTRSFANLEASLFGFAPAEVEDEDSGDEW